MTTHIHRVSNGQGETSPYWTATLDSLDRMIFDHAYQKAGSEWWLAIEGGLNNGLKAGFAGLTLYPDGPLGPVAFLCRCGVRKIARGQGLQRRLIRAREAHARRAGFDRIVTYTSRDNHVSANNLIRCGFRLYEPPYRYGLRTGLYFEKGPRP